MQRWSRASAVGALEAIYATVVLFALTQGPVYRLWSESVAVGGEEEIPNAIHVHFASFLLLQLPALMLLARRTTREWISVKALQCLFLLLGWLMVCAAFSTLARKSIPDITALVVTSLFGLYLARSFCARTLWLIVAGAMAGGVAISTLAAYRLWDGAVNLQQDYWIGIYFNRNSLAPVAAMALVGCVGVVATWRWRNDVKSWLMGLLVVIAVILGVQALAQSRSRTSVAALAIAVGLVLSWWLPLMLSNRSARLSSLRRWILPVVVLSFGVALWASFQFFADMTEFDREVTSFNSRGALWSHAWSGVLAKPVMGWGWLAAWHVREFWDQGQWWSVWGENDWSHSGYFDMMLGGGFPAIMLLTVFVLIAAAKLGVAMPVRVAAGRVLLVGFVLVAATQESFFVGSHFMWALLVAMFLTDNEQQSVQASNTRGTLES
jgi:O-antigen ligase